MCLLLMLVPRAALVASIDVASSAALVKAISRTRRHYGGEIHHLYKLVPLAFNCGEHSGDVHRKLKDLAKRRGQRYRV